MRFFLHFGDVIRIINEPFEFTCTVSQFQVLEPLYPALPTGKNVRYWTPEHAYLDGDALAAIDHDCGAYAMKCEAYNTPGPFIYAHVSLSKTTLCINSDPPDGIAFEVHLKGSADPESGDLPIDHTWNIRLRNENDLFYDAFEMVFEDGLADGHYCYQDGLPLGVYYINENDFDKVTAGGVTYTVKLIEPLKFTLYREL